MKQETINLIEIEWEGPYTLDKIKSKNGSNDFGLYQIYGTHNIHGADVLLYIGQANKQKFSARLSQHEHWINEESSDLKFYVGRLGGVANIEVEKWNLAVDIAEKILIYTCSPIYNSSSMNWYGNIEPHTIVVNLGKYMRLPQVASTLWAESDYWKRKETGWKTFEE